MASFVCRGFFPIPPTYPKPPLPTIATFVGIYRATLRILKRRNVAPCRCMAWSESVTPLNGEKPHHHPALPTSITARDYAFSKAISRMLLAISLVACRCTSTSITLNESSISLDGQTIFTPQASSKGFIHHPYPHLPLTSIRSRIQL